MYIDEFERPDDDWLRSVSEALEHWQRIASGHSPTSSITGGGAIEVAEAAFSALHGGRPTLMMPSATFALRIALLSLAVRPGDDVLVPAIDWTATRAAVLSIGARPVPVAVDPRPLTMDPGAARQVRTPMTTAAVVCHLHGVPADVDGIRDALPGVSVIEDCAQALGGLVGSAPVGTLAHAAVFSLGPGKPIDAGEGGLLVLSDGWLYRRAVKLACHPVRQVLAGIATPRATSFSVRPHPLAAVLALQRLHVWDPDQARQQARAIAEELSDHPDLEPLTPDGDRTMAGPGVPVLRREGVGDPRPPAGLLVAASGARPLPGVRDARTLDLASRVAVAWRRPPRAHLIPPSGDAC
jgi:dTDP-4-amino-4,6-dideoxygalactose transaminase